MSTILIVDDDPDSQWTLQLVLERRGHHVVLSDDGLQALQMASRYLPDVIVTDWNMPHMEGDVLCERLKWYPALALIPIIMMSAQAQPSNTVGAWDYFFRKPVSIDALAETVDSLATKRLGHPSISPRVSVIAPCRRPAEAFKYWV